MASRSIPRAATSAASACLLAACLAALLVVLFVALLAALLVACSGKPPAPQRPAVAADAALRIRVARAEALRGGGLAELVALAAPGAGRPPAERALALRGLGRIGGARALEVLRGALADPDAGVAAAAAGALGVAASLDELDAEVTAALTAALVAALPRAGANAPIVLEALGRAADASAQPALAAELGQQPARAEAAAVALGRHGRRKIALSPAAREALVAATRHTEAAVRYAAVWALGREHLPAAADPAGEASAAPAAADPSDAVTAALVARLADDGGPELRAQAVAALARRKRAAAAWRSIEGRLADPDWRVAAEAVRALTGEQSDGLMRAAAARGLAVRTARLLGDEREAHVVIEGLRGLLARAADEQRPEDAAEITTTVRHLARFAGSSTLPAITRGWIDCLAQAVLARRTGAADFAAVLGCGARELPDHLRLPLVAQLIEAKTASVAVRRAALDALLAHADARVRAAGLGAIAPLWPELDDDAARRALARAVIGALGAADPVVAGTAAEVAPGLYERLGDQLLREREALDAAVIGRAARAHDVELAASLLDLIGKRKLAAGAGACRASLGGHPVLARAAAACLAALGEPAPSGASGTPGTPGTPDPAPAPAPPVDVAAVIGRSVRWKLVTSRGPVTIALSPDAAPWAVAAIAALTRKGYYDGLEVHRVVPDFVVQGGDPTQSGWGGPGFSLPAEPSDGTVSGLVAGGVGVADAGRDSGGSQWFVMHARAPYLDGRYTWIGRVEEGQAAADALQIGDRVLRAMIEVVPE
ncbi:MAG TPA: peptidylprolyl isomerase [Kofleriaceae bacterium]|nr:peptidylprolyl isomerase [Kofleriaceae bacterium]